MVQVSLNAVLKVAGGPTLPVSSSLEPDSYVFASVVLDAADSEDEAVGVEDVPLLHGDGQVLLLAVRARRADGSDASVTVTPSIGITGASGWAVKGTLVVANADVLAALVTEGPRAVTVANTETVPVTVDILACLGPEPPGD